MYYLPVNVAINFHEIRLISTFQINAEQNTAEFHIPLGEDVPTNVIITACSHVSFPDKFINEEVHAAKLISSLINSFVFCKAVRQDNVDDKILEDMSYALTCIYHYVKPVSKEGEWNVVKKKNRWPVRKWINREIMEQRPTGDIIRQVMPYVTFIGECDYKFKDVKWFENSLKKWLKKSNRKEDLEKMYKMYISYF